MFIRYDLYERSWYPHVFIFFVKKFSQNPEFEDVTYSERIEASVYCIAHIDCSPDLLDSAYTTWIKGIAEKVEPVVQNYTVVLKVQKFKNQSQT